MHIDWLGMAEGSVTDGRGVITAVGLNMDVYSPEHLPAHTRRDLLLFIRCEPGELQQDDHIDATIWVERPDGVRVVQTSNRLAGQHPFPFLPASINLAAAVQFEVTEYGTHQFGAEVVHPTSGATDMRRIPLHVLTREQMAAAVPADRGTQH